VTQTHPTMKTGTEVLNVLFVDDDADEFYLFNEAIEQSEQQVNMTRAKDGNDLMKILSTGNYPDIIFMDLNMPYKDGLETLVELKSSSAFQNIPVIIFSTTSNSTQINTCYEQGANMYVVKPESFDQITNMVTKVFALDWKTKASPTSFSNFVLKY
jgi:CheY-like chemotaxis protein